MLFAAAALIAAGCGDDDAPLPLADAGTAPAPTAPAPRVVDGTSGSTGGPPAPAPIPVECPLGTTVERESNDAVGAANAVVDLAFCGAISPGSDIDFARFETPAGKKLALFQAVIEGQVDFDLQVNGKTLKPAEVRSFEAGAYVVRIFTRDARPGKYRFRIQFEP